MRRYSRLHFVELTLLQSVSPLCDDAHFFSWLDTPPFSFPRVLPHGRLHVRQDPRCFHATRQVRWPAASYAPTHASCRMADSTCVNTHAASTRPDKSGDQPRHMTPTHAASTRPVMSADQPRHKTPTTLPPRVQTCQVTSCITWLPQRISSPSLKPEPPLPLYLRVVCPSKDQPRDAEDHAASTRSDRSGGQPHHMT